MRDAESMDFKVGMMKQSLGGKEDRRMPTSRGPKYDNPTLADIIRFIEKLQVAEDSKKVLLGVAKKMPNGSLANFRENYTRYLKKSN